MRLPAIGSTVLFAAWILLGAAQPALAQEIGFAEDFALADDRAAPLDQLIPGTEEYYFYHCLHYQNTEQFEKVDQLLKSWISRHKYTPRVRQILNRQALLTYPQRSAESLEYVRKQLNLEFNHQRVTVGQKPNLPTALDPKRISRERLLQDAKNRYKNLQGVEDSALDWLVATELNRDRRRHLLERLQRPDYANLPDLVVADLKAPYSRGFGSLKIHRLLLLKQLDACLQKSPNLLNQNNFVNAYLVKLRPNDDVDWRRDPAQKEAYLDRLWGFARRLAPVHNSLKAHVLYHRLVLDRSRGVYDKERFLTYVRLPRNAGYVNRDYLKKNENQRYAANLNQDFGSQTLFPRVGNDEPLVRAYLQHFFAADGTVKDYADYIDNTYLKHAFAETKLVNGLGDPEQWYSDLPPAQLQVLRERVDLDFAATNRKQFRGDDPVSLDVYVKNVKTLIVKVYEINTWNYYRQQSREVNADINLDGLVANEELTFSYAEPSLRRVRRHFDFPLLAEPGVYVIDFIGNGKSSRVVVRKGRLRHLVETTTAGHLFTVLDENNQKLNDARLWMGGKEYVADDDGRIAVPFSNRPQTQSVVLSHGDFSSLATFRHDSESYSLKAGIYVDRESLIKQRLAKITVRPGLILNGVPVTLSVLEDVKLILTSTDMDGVQTTKEVQDFELSEAEESQYEFRVPDRLSTIAFRLEAKVRNLSQNQNVDLSANAEFKLNQIDRTDKIEDLHLSRIDGKYVVDVLGKSGESRADRPVKFQIKHRDFRTVVNVSLQSDKNGRIQLGSLDGIVQLVAEGPNAVRHVWPIDRGDVATFQAALHGVAGGSVELPYMGNAKKPMREELSLLELRGDAFVADRFSALSIKDGMLQVQGLPAGDYDLLFKRQGRRVRIRMTAGEKELGYVLGDYRQLEVRGENPLQIASVDLANDELKIRLQNAGEFTRVHVLATRYAPEYPLFSTLSKVGDVAPLMGRVSQLDSLYMEGRNIGDEYRYIIDRRYAKRFPGNMLGRPSLLLNPWAIRKTDTSRQSAADGERFAPAMDAPNEAAARFGGRGRGQSADVGGFSNLDFLGDPATVLLNLSADEDGVVTIDRSKIGPHQELRIVAVDPRSTIYRTLSLPEQAGKFNDLRLVLGLDPEEHFTQQKQISMVPGGGKFELADLAASKFEAYDTLQRVYSLYTTLSGDAKLAEFGFILQWPQLDAAEKRAKYSKYACHELNFFLLQKDPEFFENAVLPFLANKKDRTFLDRWLLGEDLQVYLQPWRYQQLNVVERILLAQRIEGEIPHTSRLIQHRFDLIPPDVDRFNQLFRTAIRGRSLDSSDDLGVLDAKTEALAELEMQVREKDVRLRQMNRGLAMKREEDFARPSSKPQAAAPPAPAAAPQPSRPGVGGRPARKSAEMAKKSDKAWFADGLKRRAAMDQLYRKLDKTQEWVENNYYQLPIESQNGELVQVNAFWRDYAHHNFDQPFLTSNLAEATGSFTEMMFALALLDLPFQAGKHETKFENNRMDLEAASPMVVFHEEVRPAGDLAEQTPILVSQNFFRHGDRYRYVNNEKVDKYVVDEFLIHTVYGCQIVVTNPTSTRQKLDLLLQIPVGAVPVLNGRFTNGLHVDLQPFNTKTLEYYFYFPEPGDFPHYPVHVAKNEQLLAHAAPFEFHVVESLSRIDRGSWAYVSQNGTDQEVLDYLRVNNLLRDDLGKIAFRMQNRDYFLAVTELLATQHVYNHTLWSYSVKHDAVPQIREFLQHSDSFVQQCGDWLESPLLTIDPVVRKTYQHMDYRPLVNARAHQLGRRRQILNGRFHQQYHRLMRLLGYRRTLDDVDLMAVTYYMLLQDRIEEAKSFFARVNPERLETRLQYDYFVAYLDFFNEQPEQARQIAQRYVNHPVDRWRNVFANVKSQLDELGGKAPEFVDAENREQRQTELASRQPGFDFVVESGTVKMNFQNLSQITVNYYEMDVELLFSRNPFVQQFSGQFSFIRPNGTQRIDLPAGESAFSFQLPEQLLNKNVLVEVVAAGQAKTQAYYSNSMAVQIIETYGQLRVTGRDSGKPLSTVYVKVYARMKDGSVRFFKDGYTDIRGRFDFSSLSTNELDSVAQFSLLLLSDEAGAIVREARPPKQ